MSDVEPRRAPQGRHHFHPPDPRDARDTPLRPGEAAALPNRPRPPRPWYAQITGQWPLAITLLGVAIGLAIVAAICQTHHAELQLADSASLGGLQVRVVFPAPPAGASPAHGARAQELE